MKHGKILLGLLSLMISSSVLANHNQIPQKGMEKMNIIEHHNFIGEFELTAYCKCKICSGKWHDAPCKNGEYPTEGYTIAVDPRVIPLDSLVMIGGVEYKAMDTGSAIKGNIIDVYFDKHSDALEFGRKKGIKVYAIESGEGDRLR